ncbi:esterase-like activity of phytase family protein [Pseudomonas sp. UL073]|uniref:Esterase-like activity of phytase family protein n=1 Tax=Zestomonas insulae TaxID=2809017 RepID=A0ABS2IGB6_9GAMM|nr:esterase-like activity of phytase family protein [Pseudomonas insulae]MBM7061208.1 esterase-like activity of phytase family protein [Pseudomonas insulae]
MTRAWLAALLLIAGPLRADPAALPVLEVPAELKLQAEYAVDGMPAGNLSGLAWCGDALWAVSDREDDRLYRLTPAANVLRAEAERFSAPPVVDNGLPWGLRTRTWLVNQFRGGDLDFEGLSCDAAGNRYLVSEAHVAVLKLAPAANAGEWLPLSPGVIRQARASGMLLHFNALLEGIAIDPQGERLWLAAERERRGLLVLHKKQAQWACTGGCVLLSEGGSQPGPAGYDLPAQPRDFSDLAFFAGKLFSLERQAYRICRRKPASGEVERCWSFAAEALQEARRYGSQAYGMAEGLSLDEKGAWIGLDSGTHTRNDGETRPIVWRFAAPAGGWSAAK